MLKKERLILSLLILFVFLFSVTTVYSEEVPRRLCAFVEIEDIATGKFDRDVLKDIQAIGKGIIEIEGISFDIKDKVAVLKKGQSIEIGIDRLKYAGEGGIESQDDHNRGPLVFYKIEAIYFLHTIVGSSTKSVIGKWIFRYRDGTSAEQEIRIGENIGSKGKNAEWAKKVGATLYLTEVTNLYLDKDTNGISIEIRGDAEYILVGMTCKLGRQKVHD